jgi:hypothetical protein
MLLAAIEADQAELARWIGASEEAEAASAASPAAPPSADEAARIERYCEYFRRQLAGAADVEAMLEEMDSGTR